MKLNYLLSCIILTWSLNASLNDYFEYPVQQVLAKGHPSCQDGIEGKPCAVPKLSRLGFGYTEDVTWGVCDANTNCVAAGNGDAKIRLPKPAF